MSLSINLPVPPVKPPEASAAEASTTSSTSGGGISPEAQERVQDIFTQGLSAITLQSIGNRSLADEVKDVSVPSVSDIVTW